MSTTSWLAYGLTGDTNWLYRPRTPNAASNAVIARMSGTAAATTAPNATSRIAKVSGIVIWSDASRSLLTSSEMSSFARVLLSAWIV